MENIYLVRTAEELERYQQFTGSIQRRLKDYVLFLKREYEVRELPRAIVWTGADCATGLISDIPVPAYTNDCRVIMTPDPEVWRSIYLKQLDGLSGEKIEKVRDYYDRGLTQDHILQILGHELAHHSEYFPDSDDSEGIWFEEGMVEYISRRYFLTPEEFEAEAEINRLLVELHSERAGSHSLEEFGPETYKSDFGTIFFEYWRSFLTVNRIIETHHGDVKRVLSKYRQWCEGKPDLTLEEWFGI